jgi:hypothetical protein
MTIHTFRVQSDAVVLHESEANYHSCEFIREFAMHESEVNELDRFVNSENRSYVLEWIQHLESEMVQVDHSQAFADLLRHMYNQS